MAMVGIEDLLPLGVEQAVRHLSRLWSYESAQARCFSFLFIDGSGNAKPTVLCPEDKDSMLKSLEDNVRDLLVKNYSMPGSNLYFQVLPLARRPERGRGSAGDVVVGRWLWADLDFKETVDEPAFTGCLPEGTDHSLECYYGDGDKWVHIKRPPLDDVIKYVRERVGVEPTLAVDSGGGYHLYWELSRELPADELRRLEEWLVDVLGADRQSKDLARVLRLPGSVNPRSGRMVTLIRDYGTRLDPDELRLRLSSAGAGTRAGVRVVGGFRRLSEVDLVRTVDLLGPAYREGLRQYLVLFLSGWLAKARVYPLDAVRLVKMLHEKYGDTDPLKERLSAVVYSYKKAGINIDVFAGEIEEVAGVRPYGLEREIREEEVKGKSGLQEVLEEVLGEERALAVIKELEDILQVASPFRDSVIELLDYERQLYAVADLRRLIVVRARRENNVLRYKERVALGAPTTVEVYINPLGGVTKYRVRWEVPTRPRPLVIGPAGIDEIVDRLRLENLVYSTRLARDVVGAIIIAFERRGRAIVREEIEAPGFYLVNGKIVAVNVDTNKPRPEELRKSLELLDELASSWFNHVIDRFAVVIKWGVIAPLIYTYKQRSMWVPWLYLYGASRTGKTTLGDIVLSMWGLDVRFRKTGANIDTPARIGHVLSQSTFPIVVNEPGAAIVKEDIVEMIKNAVESTIVRGRFSRGSYEEVPSLSPVIFTSNRVLPRDDALLRRFIVLRFTYGERIPEDRAREFEGRVKPRLGELSVIGRFVANAVVADPSILDKDWEETSMALLEMAYREVGMTPPAWLFEEIREEFDVYEDVREAIRDYLVRRINEEYARFVGRVVVETSGDSREEFRRNEVDFTVRVRVVLMNRLLPWAMLKEDDTVVFTTGLADELQAVVGDVGGLKGVAELLGWEYVGYSYRENGRVRHMKVARTTLQGFVEFLTMP